MKFLIKNTDQEKAKVVIRRFGYALIFDRRSGQESLVRRLGDGHYPRFHLYLEDRGGDCVASLHLDQKRASYEGQHMHSAEYDGELVEGEVDHLLSLFVGSGYEVMPFNKKHQTLGGSSQGDNQEKKSINNHENIDDLLSVMPKADLDRDLGNFQKNTKKKRFLFF